MKASTRKQNQLFIIGNGFDLAHGLPTRFDPDFKDIAIGNEPDNRFWDLYQSEGLDIWSDFENLLAKPDFDELSQIFDAYMPDYLSDYESDRDSIITQADISGNLNKSLIEFATNAENKLPSAKQKCQYKNRLTSESLYVNFNYTHTLEILYGIPRENVLHIHGEVGGNKNLLLGYAASDFDVGDISEDIKGRSRSIPTMTYINKLEDYYQRAAYESLLRTIQSWEKPYQKDFLKSFVEGAIIDEIIVIGFSFGKVDAVYFELLQRLYPRCQFVVVAIDKRRASDYERKISEYYGIDNYVIELF